MSKVIEIATNMSEAGKGWIELIQFAEQAYEVVVKGTEVPLRDENGEVILHHQLWYPCCCYAMLVFKEVDPRLYGLLVAESGGEMRLIQRVMLC